MGRIVVLISGSGSNLIALAEACASGTVPGQIVLVAADRHCEGLVKAAGKGLETALIEPKTFADRDEWSAALKARVEAAEPDLVVSAGFMRILAPVFVDAFEGRLINLHPALLPAFPGAHAVRDALAAGVTETGTTVHFIDRLVDHGPTILQQAVPIEPSDDENSLHERIKAAEHRLLPRACRLLLEGKIRLRGREVEVADE